MSNWSQGEGDRCLTEGPRAAVELAGIEAGSKCERRLSLLADAEASAEPRLHL
jgi:hypothetical protein